MRQTCRRLSGKDHGGFKVDVVTNVYYVHEINECVNNYKRVDRTTETQKVTRKLIEPTKILTSIRFQTWSTNVPCTSTQRPPPTV